MKKILLFIFALCFYSSAIFATHDIYPFHNDADKSRFTALTGQFRCLVCKNETLADSQAGLANDLRQQIYTMVTQGASNKQITDYMVHRYGEFVLYRPPFNTNTLLLWLAPLLMLLSAIVVISRSRYR